MLTARRSWNARGGFPFLSRPFALLVLLVTALPATGPGQQFVTGHSEPGANKLPFTGLELLDTIRLDPGESDIRQVLYDEVGGFAYLVTSTNPARVVKVKVTETEGLRELHRVGTVELATGETAITGVLNAEFGHAYFGTETEPGKVVKIALGEGDDPPVRIGALTLPEGESFLTSAIIDEANQVAYFGTATSPGKIIRVGLFPGDTIPSRMSSLELEEGEDELRAAVIDEAGRYGWFGAKTHRVIQVDLGEGTDPMLRKGSASARWKVVEAVRNDADSELYFRDTGYSQWIFSGYGCPFPQSPCYTLVTEPGTVEGFTLDDEGDPPTNSFGNISLATVFSSDHRHRMAIDPLTGSGLLAASSIKRFPLGVAEEPTPLTQSAQLASIAVDPARRLLIAASTESPARVYLFSIDHSEHLLASRITVELPGEVEEMRFFSHAAEGNLRFALYNDNEPRQRLWDSGPIANTVANGEIVIPVSAGTPSSLTLAPGDYWLVWQTDDVLAQVGSRSHGEAGMHSGFHFRHPFGDAPTAISSTDESFEASPYRWTHYLVYDHDETQHYSDIWTIQ